MNMKILLRNKYVGYLIVVVIIIGLCVIMYAVTALDNKRNNIESAIEHKPLVEVQKEKCDSLYLDYISEYTAYQMAIINGENDYLINLLKNRYQQDSILLQYEMQLYFNIINDLNY